MPYIDFVPILKNDLDEVGINYQSIAEGDCLAVKHLHYNAEIREAQAIFLYRITNAILTSRSNEIYWD